MCLIVYPVLGNLVLVLKQNWFSIPNPNADAKINLDISGMHWFAVVVFISAVWQIVRLIHRLKMPYFFKCLFFCCILLVFFVFPVLLFDVFLSFLMFIVKCPWALERRYINKTYYYYKMLFYCIFNMIFFIAQPYESPLKTQNVKSYLSFHMQCLCQCQIP